MKALMIVLLTFNLAYTFDESKQIQLNHPLQNPLQSNKLLCEMQSDIKTYLYETPLSSYAFFNEKSSELKSQSLITWVHGDLYIETLAVSEGPKPHPLLNKEKTTHLGDYRYDIFTVLSDLLLQMQESSDFSGSKEKAILGTLIDGYFEGLTNRSKKCQCIDDALLTVRKNDLLLQYTKVSSKKRVFNTNLEYMLKVDEVQSNRIKDVVDKHLAKLDLLPIKDIVTDAYGDYLLLSDGKSSILDDDIIFTLSAQTLPASYRVDEQLKKDYWNKSLSDRDRVIASFNKNRYAKIISIGDQEFSLNKLHIDLKLRPASEETNAYKDYAAALGYMLASFHSNSAQTSCRDFAKKANQQVKPRLLKTEIISMVYAYNETLENRWGSFNQKKMPMCN